MNKVAVITGVSYGIGKSITELLLVNGYKVYGLSRSKPNYENSNFTWIKIDLSNNVEIEQVAEYISEEHINLLINNAGVFIAELGMNFSEKSFQNIFNLNFKAPIYLTKKLKSKLQNSIVINISSVSDRIPEEECALYCASKAALNMFFDCVSLEEREIKFISILPSYVDTPLLRRSMEGIIPPFDWDEIIKPEHISVLVEKIIQNSNDYQSGLRIIVINNALKEDLGSFENLKVYHAEKELVLDIEQARKI